MSSNNKVKRKVLTQRHVCSRMNFLYQAANLMAHSKNNTLAAYYGRLCRNVGTKALMHMSPALKRTLCKRCSQPLLPGVNTKLMVEGKRGKEKEQQQLAIESNAQKASETLDDKTQLYLECNLCRSRRRFHVDTEKECWPERAEAIVQTVCLEQPAGDSN